MCWLLGGRVKAHQADPILPEGWYYPEDREVAESLYAEFIRELPVGHLLSGKPVAVFAYRRGTDDVLFRHREEPERFTVIHLSWIGKQEMHQDFPFVEFDGSLEGFLQYEQRFSD